MPLFYHRLPYSPEHSYREMHSQSIFLNVDFKMRLPNLEQKHIFLFTPTNNFNNIMTIL